MTRDLGHGVDFEVHEPSGCVTTRYADGFSCTATREDTPDNRSEICDQGYADHGYPIDDDSMQRALLRSLIEHELLHTTIARAVFGRESIVLRHESGAERQRYALRLHEEALVLSFQRWLNTEDLDPILLPYGAALPHLRRAMRETLKY